MKTSFNFTFQFLDEDGSVLTERNGVIYAESKEDAIQAAEDMMFDLNADDFILDEEF